MVLISKTNQSTKQEGKVTVDAFNRFMRGEINYPEYAPGELTPEDSGHTQGSGPHLISDPPTSSKPWKNQVYEMVNYAKSAVHRSK